MSYFKISTQFVLAFFADYYKGGIFRAVLSGINAIGLNCVKMDQSITECLKTAINK